MFSMHISTPFSHNLHVSQSSNSHAEWIFQSLTKKKQHTPKTQHSTYKSIAVSTLSSRTEILELENHPEEPALLSRLNPLAIEWPLDKNNQSRRNLYLLQINSMLNPWAVSEPENYWFFLHYFLLSLLPFLFLVSFFFFLTFMHPSPSFSFGLSFLFLPFLISLFSFISCLFESVGGESPPTCLPLLVASKATFMQLGTW